MAKHVPERSCVACRTVRPKRHLVRLVRVGDAAVEIDTTWRKSGRGAYLCPAQECWRLAAKRKSLDLALGIIVTPAMWQTLDAYAEGLPAKKFDT